MIKIIFSMYNPETDCVEVSLDNKIHVFFDYQKCNASVRLVKPSDIAYLTRLVRKEPRMYANPEMVSCKDMLRLWGSLIKGSP